MKKIKLLFIVLFLVAIFSSIDLGFNFLWTLVPEANDGIGAFGILNGIFKIFGDNLWSQSRYLQAFQWSAWITFVLLAVNVVLTFWKKRD